jgi:hypothetical protein
MAEGHDGSPAGLFKEGGLPFGDAIIVLQERGADCNELAMERERSVDFGRAIAEHKHPGFPVCLSQLISE